jgi:hypothetical protein
MVRARTSDSHAGSFSLGEQVAAFVKIGESSERE